MPEHPEIQRFRAEVADNIAAIRTNRDAQAVSADWLRKTHTLRYDYNFSWMGRPVIQLPQDLIAMQEIIWRGKPDLIIETGVAHGGSLIFHASMLHLLGGAGRVLGIDIDIRSHNRAEIEAHPMSTRIDLVEGSSIDAAVVAQATQAADRASSVMVILDSMHSHAHVLAELHAYAPMVTQGSYLVVCDTIIEQLGGAAFPDRPWGDGDNPATALREFLAGNDRFEVDEDLCGKLLLSNSPGGYLRCV